MLGLLRKYQKILFFIISFVIIISFTFFGSFHTQSISYVKPILSKTLSGASVPVREVEKMKVFLRRDVQDFERSQELLDGNFFNEGILKKYFFQSGLAALLLHEYATNLQTPLKAIHEKEKQFVLYKHPYLPKIHVESIWEDFSPKLSFYYKQLMQVTDPLSPEGIEARVHCFLEQQHFHQDLLKRFIYFEESRQASHSQMRDSYLERRDLSLFRHKGVEDWFSPQFLPLAAQFIFQLSDLAEQRGYSVSNGEIEAYIHSLLDQQYQQLASQLEKQQIKAEDLMHYQLQRMGLSYSDLKEIMKTLLPFIRFVDDLQLAPLESPFILQSFQRFSKKRLHLTQTTLPPAFHFKNLSDLISFEFYKELVAQEEFHGAIRTYKPLEELQQAQPFMVQKSFKARVKHINKEVLASRYSLKQTWDWQLQDPSHWSMIQKDFPHFNLPNLTQREEKFEALAKLSPEQRDSIDRYTRGQLLLSQANWLSEAMQLVEGKEELLNFQGKDLTSSFPGITDANALLKELEGASSPFTFSQDQQHFYTFEILSKKAPSLLTFQEAKSSPGFVAYTKKQLQTLYQQSAFLGKNGKKLSFEEALALIAEKRFASSFQKVQQALKDLGIEKEFPQKFSASFLTRHRLAPLLAYVKQSAENQSTLPSFLQPHSTALTEVERQFAPVIEEKKLTREEIAGQALELLQLQPKQWSSIAYPLEGNAHFFYLDEVEEGVYQGAKELMEMQRYLGEEMSIFFFHQIIEALKQGQHIVMTP